LWHNGVALQAARETQQRAVRHLDLLFFFRPAGREDKKKGTSRDLLIQEDWRPQTSEARSGL
jgi:hypothetical protein